MAKQKQNDESLTLALIHPHAAGLDVGSMNMMVSFPGIDGLQTVKEYTAYTKDLNRMADDLHQAGVTHICMEATGVYWMTVYEILEKKGLSVTLVNARNYKNVDGQKTDVKDCQWLQQLHAHGLLRSAHVADEQYRELRIYIHERGVLQNNKSSTLNRIHKVLTQMNIKLQHVISDIEGVSGMAVLELIASGETSAEKLLSVIDIKRFKASKELLLESLEGMFKPHLIAVLRNHLEQFNFYKMQMLQYETLIEDLLKRMLPTHQHRRGISDKKTKARKNQYSFNLKEYLHRIAGVDLTAIDGLDENTVLTIISVVGLNMNKWPTADHFTSWLNLAARPNISGGKVIGHQKRFTNNTATQAFRLAAQTMWQNKGTLGHLYKRLSHTKGSKKAIKAVARRLAVIFYTMLKKQTAYDPKIIAIDEEKIKRKKIERLRKDADKLGLTIVMPAA